MDPLIFLGCVSALIAGCFIRSLIGFGMGVIAAPFILWLDPKLMPCLIVVTGTFASSAVLFQYWRHLCLKDLGFAFLGRLPGTFLAAYALMLVSESDLFVILGVSILITVFLSVYKIRLMPTPVTLFVGGLFSGLMGTATGIGGPPIAILFQNEDPNKLRANLAAYFVITNIISLIALHYSGRFSLREFTQCLWLVPLPVLSTFVAYRLRDKVKGEWIRYSILGMCSVSAVISLTQGLHLF